MKIRNGFVSNSSSSSFIVIGSGTKIIPHCLGELFVPGDFGGNTEFGWEVEMYDSFGDRLNFAYIQATYNSEWLEMLEEVIKENMNVTSINWNITTKWDDKEKVHGYIDHQSSACDNRNVEMFDSKEDLCDFLFCTDSYIQGDNDNR